jgi:hypothetical protein
MSSIIQSNIAPNDLL